MKIISTKNIRRQNGFSLLELMIAIVVFTIGLIPTITLFINMRKGLENREEAVTAALVGQNLMETIRSKKWDQNSTVPPTYVTNRSIVTDLKFDTGETSPNLYNDVDDYNGTTDFSMVGFKREVMVEYVTVDMNASTAVATYPTDFKQIKIVVSWGPGYKKKKTIQTVVANSF